MIHKEKKLIILIICYLKFNPKWTYCNFVQIMTSILQWAIFSCLGHGTAEWWNIFQDWQPWWIQGYFEQSALSWQIPHFCRLWCLYHGTRQSQCNLYGKLFLHFLIDLPRNSITLFYFRQLLMYLVAWFFDSGILYESAIHR